MNNKTLVFAAVLVLMVLFAAVPAPAAEQQDGRLSELLAKSEGIQKEIKTIDFDKLGDKVIELGNKVYEFLQKGSLPLLVVGVGIAVAFLFLGIFIGRLIKVGIAGIVISFAVYFFINYMPETVATIKHTLSSILN